MDLFGFLCLGLANSKSGPSCIDQSDDVESIEYHGSKTGQIESYDHFIGLWHFWHVGQWHTFHDLFIADA